MPKISPVSLDFRYFSGPDLLQRFKNIQHSQVYMGFSSQYFSSLGVWRGKNTRDLPLASLQPECSIEIGLLHRAKRNQRHLFTLDAIHRPDIWKEGRYFGRFGYERKMEASFHLSVPSKAFFQLPINQLFPNPRTRHELHHARRKYAATPEDMLLYVQTNTHQ